MSGADGGGKKSRSLEFHIPCRHLFKWAFVFRILQRRWIKSMAKMWEQHPDGVLMPAGLTSGVKILPHRPFHRGRASHSDGSLRQRQLKDCLNSQDAESSSSTKLY